MRHSGEAGSRQSSKFRRSAALIAMSAVVVVANKVLRAGDISWGNSAGGSFQDGINWTGGLPPGSADNAVISVGGSTPYTVTFSTNALTAGLTVGGKPLTLSLGGNQYVVAGTSSLTGGGTLTITGGAIQTSNFYLSAPSNCTISPTGSVAVSTFEYIGRDGTGTAAMTQTGGTNSISGFITDVNGGATLGLAVSSSSASSATYALSGGSLAVTYYESIGEAGSGAMTQTAGDNNCTMDIVLGHVAGTGTYNLSGGTVEAKLIALGDFIKTRGVFNLSGNGALSITGNEQIAANQNSTASTSANFNQSGGSNIGGSMTIGNANNAVGTYTISAGTLNVSGALALNGINSNFDATGGTATFGSVANAGTIVIGGAVGPSPAAKFTVGGDFTQTAGTTQVDGALTLSTGHNFNLSGGTLKGTGSIVGSINNTGGTVSPGDSPGELNVTGNYVQGSGGILNILIDGRTPGAQFDVLSLTGTATLDGTLDVTFGSGFMPQSGDQFMFLSSAGTVGTFAAVNSTIPMNISFVGGNVSLTAVPEPAALVLVAVGLGLLSRRRSNYRNSC